jgi:hypothetical protein
MKPFGNSLCLKEKLETAWLASALIPSNEILVGNLLPKFNLSAVFTSK